MKRYLFVALFYSLILYAASPKALFKQIEESKSSLAVSKKEKKIISKQLQKIADEIKKHEKEIAALNEKLKKLDASLKMEEQKYNEAQREIHGINEMLKELDKDINERKREFAKKLSKQLGRVVAQNKMQQKDEKSVVLEEVYSRYKDFNQKELLKLSRNIEQKNALRKNLIQRRDEIANSIKDVKAQKDVYKKETAIKRQLLKKLAKDQERYSKKLKGIFKRQTILRLTLTKLNLIQEDAAKAAKERERELKKRIRRLAKLKLNAKANRSMIKYEQSAISRSYLKSTTTHYRGAKTIAPVRSPKVIKSYGKFMDPIYKIESFSDSVTLTSRIGDKRVFNVLNGEVIFKGRNSMLGKMVVVEHENGLHTIYADLDKFSPFIKKGLKVKRGTVLGKVRRKLIFEATKSGKFVNPLDLISLSKSVN